MKVNVFFQAQVNKAVRDESKGEFLQTMRKGSDSWIAKNDRQRMIDTTVEKKEVCE